VKKLMLILFIAACFVFQSYAESLADEKKTVTPQEFVTAVSEVPSKIGNFVKNEVEKTKEYQKNSWDNAKKKWPWNKIFKGDNNG